MKMTQTQLDDWNATFPVGSPCVVREDDGSHVDTATRSHAWNLGDGTTVILISRFTGGYSMDRIKMHSMIDAASKLAPESGRVQP